MGIASCNIFFLDLELEGSHSECLETDENNINIQDSSNRKTENNEIESMEDGRNNYNDHDEKRNKQMEISATEETEENETDGINLKNWINDNQENENKNKENDNEIEAPEEIIGR